MIRMAALLALLAGCPPLLTAQSAAPPSRAARLDAVEDFWGVDHYRLELSQGIAIAINCSRGKPCEKLRVTSDDPNIAEVRDASIMKLESTGFAEQQTPASLVVVGKAPGTTAIRVRSAQGDRRIDVTVVAPPIKAATK